MELLRRRYLNASPEHRENESGEPDNSIVILACAFSVGYLRALEDVAGAMRKKIGILDLQEIFKTA